MTRVKTRDKRPAFTSLGFASQIVKVEKSPPGPRTNSVRVRTKFGLSVDSISGRGFEREIPCVRYVTLEENGGYEEVNGLKREKNAAISHERRTTARRCGSVRFTREHDGKKNKTTRK